MRQLFDNYVFSNAFFDFFINVLCNFYALSRDDFIDTVTEMSFIPISSDGWGAAVLLSSQYRVQLIVTDSISLSIRSLNLKQISFKSLKAKLSFVAPF